MSENTKVKKAGRVSRTLHSIVMLFSGTIYKEKTENMTTRVKKNGWVVMSDGQSKDAIPLNFCCEDFVQRVVDHTDRFKRA